MSETFKLVKLIDPIQMTISGTFTPRGAYDNATDYAVGDMVSYNGSSYIMYTDGPAGTLPTDSSYWGVVAQNGTGVPGGTANQALTKIDGTDYNVQWATIDKTFVGLGSVTNDAQLKIASNLSDLANAATALTNLGLIATATELNYTDGVTSSIQTQLDAKFTLPSLTAGSLLFSNGTTIAQDNANLFWDDTNNRLAVGGALTTTLTPTTTFNTTSNKPVLIGTTSNAGVMIGYDGSDIQARSGTNFVTNSALTLNRYGGNVGIGTSSPSQLLHLAGTGVVQTRIESSSTTGGRDAALRLHIANSGGDDPAGSIYFSAKNSSGVATDSARIFSGINVSGSGSGSGALYFQTSNNSAVLTTQMTITPSGNVGLGVTPTYKLDIAGPSTGASGFRVKNSTDGTTAQVQNLVENSAGNLGYFGISAPSYSTFAPINGGKAFIGSYQVPLSFFTQSGSAMYWYIGTTQRMSLSSTGGVLALGPTLGAATGDEYAFRLDYTVNKATSGNDYGFYLNMTDTASPGTSSLISLNVGGANKFNVSSAGVISTNGTSGVSGSFTTADAKTVTVTNGIITSIV